MCVRETETERQRTCAVHTIWGRRVDGPPGRSNPQPEKNAQRQVRTDPKKSAREKGDWYPREELQWDCHVKWELGNLRSVSSLRGNLWFPKLHEVKQMGSGRARGHWQLGLKGCMAWLWNVPLFLLFRPQHVPLFWKLWSLFPCYWGHDLKVIPTCRVWGIPTSALPQGSAAWGGRMREVWPCLPHAVAGWVQAIE